MSTHRSADRSFETKSSGSRYRHMRPAPRAWLVLGTCCAVLSASAACSPAPPGGRSLLAGGRPDFQGDCCPPGPLATAMTYNPSTGTWTKAPNMSVARAYATATPLPDGRVLIAGGYDAQIRPLASSQFFNPSS